MEEDDFSGTYQQRTPATDRTRNSRITSLDNSQNLGCAGNCTNMFCGPGHFRKQERIMRKFVRDPNVTANQEGSGNGSY